MKNKSSNQLWWKIGIFLLIAIYFITHLTSLNLLPVFADESIYIRWSQLIIDDWKRYLFFAMNDGKTPLFVWLTTIALKFWNDPLIAGRMISVIAGIFQVFVTAKIVKKLKGGLVAQLLSAFSVMFLPFWFFHHRMALMDGLLTLLLSISLLLLLFNYLLVFTKAVEKTTMYKTISTQKLREGDCITSRLKSDDKIVYTPSVHGVKKSQIELIQKHFKEVHIKEGISFAPTFLIAFLVTILKGNSFLFILTPF